VPEIETAVTKQGLSRYAAVLRPIEEVRQSIRERAEIGAGKAGDITPYRIGTPAEIRVEYSLTGHADQVPIIAGRERIDARTVAYRASNVAEAMQLL
jgi:D-amino peptidase